MATAISLASEVCDDVPRWYSAAVVVTVANVPVALGYSCVTDLCIQHLFEEEYTALVLGTDYTADLDAGTVTFLTALEGTAIAYFNVIVCATAEECKTAPCCPPETYDYQSIESTDSGTETNEGCVEIEVTVHPVSGSFMFFPTYVVLSADHDDAIIRYTTDGTDPDEFSTLYEGPFEVTQAGTIVKASATVGDCSAGPITTILFQNPPFEIGMVYNCDTPDHGGTWDAFAANGTVDNHWALEFTPTVQTEVLRLDVHQLDTMGARTGLNWSTGSEPDLTLEDLFNPVIWLKGDAVPGLADGAAVTTWPDSSGNGNDASQGTAANKPLYKTAIVNGLPVVRFDGTTDEMTLTAPAASAMTIFLVAKKRSVPGGLQANVLAIGADGLGQLGSNSGVHASQWTFYNGGHTAIGGVAENWTILTLRFDSLSSLSFYVDGVFAVTIDPANSFSTGAGIWLGAYGASNFGDYDIAEMLLYESALTGTQQQAVEAYLDEKYFGAAITHETWPLLVFQSGVQQWASYQNTLGQFGASSHTLDLYGDRAFPVGGFFELNMMLADGTTVTSIIDTTCTVDPPAPCPSPATPTVTGKCDGAVDVTFVGDIMQDFRVYVSSGAGETLADSGTMGISPRTVEVSGLTPGQLYSFRVELEYVAAGCGFQSSASVSAVPLQDPVVTIDTDKTVVNPNESFTISWDSDHIGGATCGGCADGQVSINQSMGCKAGNASGSQAQSQATPGIYTYTITGCNTCGTVVASVQVEVLNVAVCSVQPAILNMANPTTFACGFYEACDIGGAFEFGVPWNGQIPKIDDCEWSVCFLGGCSPPGFEAFISACLWVYLSGGQWILDIGFPGGGVDGTHWHGTKGFGNSPLGTYTQTSGCFTGPATITLT